MGKGRDKQGREQKKPKKAKKAGADLTATLPLRHHSVSSTPAPSKPAEQSESQ
jgi:hypothetical protein